MRARLDLQRSIRGLFVKRWQIGQRKWQTGRLEDPYLKARVLKGGEHASVQFCRWAKIADLLDDEVRHGAIKILPVNKKGYWCHGDPLNAMIIRIEVPHMRAPALPVDHRTCEATWSRRTFTETGCGRPAVGRFRIGGRGTRRRLAWLCAQCAADGV